MTTLASLLVMALPSARAQEGASATAEATAAAPTLESAPDLLPEATASPTVAEEPSPPAAETPAPSLTVEASPTPTVDVSLPVAAPVSGTSEAAQVQLYAPFIAAPFDGAAAAGTLEEAPAAPQTPTPTATPDPFLEALLAQMEAAEAAPALYVLDDAADVEEAAVSERLTFTATVTAQGGEVAAFEGRVQVRFAAEAVAEPLTVRVRPAVGKGAPPESLSGWPLEITAWGEESGAEVHSFKEPVQIVLHYEEAWIEGDEESLYLFFYDEVEHLWRPLPSRVEAEENLLIAETDHFSVFDFDVQNWEAARLPSLSGFQVADFTGAAQYSYALTLPPGPGGWAPQLALSYNSQVVDGATNRTQADWVGMGWSFDVGAVERFMRGTDHTGDDVFILTLNGASHRLVRDGAGRWRTEDDAYLRIEYSGDPEVFAGQGGAWTVWDKEGNRYVFGDNGDRATYARYIYPTTTQLWTWRWSLSRAISRFGQVISYAYAYEGVKKNCGQYYQASESQNNVATYPSEILYPNGKYRVRFERMGRSDYEGGWTDPCANVRFQRSLLSRIVVEHHNGAGWETVRRYDLTYDFNAVFPGVFWGVSGRTPALVKIQEFDANGNSLPPTTFTYGDAMHLTAAENGYKGRIEFSYALWSDDRGVGGDDAVQSGGRCSQYSWGTNGQTDTLCSSSSGQSRGFYFKARGDAVNNHGRVHTANYFRIFRPGGAYRIVSKFERWDKTPHQVRTGLDYGGDVVWEAGDPQTNQPFWALPESGEQLVDATLVLPATASRMWLTYEGNAVLRVFIGYDTLTRYRVVQKRLIDQVTNTVHVFEYSYDEPAVNDPLHSAVVKNVLKDDWSCCRNDNRAYVDPFTEFRGHAMVRERGPDGRIRYTWRRQDDVRKGKTVRVQEGWEESFDGFAVSRLQDVSGWGWAGEAALVRVQGDHALRIHNPAVNWSVSAYRSAYTVQDSELAQLQFRVAATGAGAPMAVLALESEDGRRWGVFIKSDRSVVVQRNDGDGDQEVFTLLGAGEFQYDRWYVLQLGVDNVDMVRLWLRDATPEEGAEARHAGGYVSGNKNWRFRGWISAGALTLDAYSEMRFFRERVQRYWAEQTATWPRTRSDGKPLLGVAAYWHRLDHVTTLEYSGKPGFVGQVKQVEYLYEVALQGGAQYGNATHRVEKAWNGQTFVAYRATQWLYYPRNDATRYVVGLPAREIVFRCPNGACTYSLGDAVQTRHLVYDDQPHFWAPPVAGALTRERRLVCYANASNQCVSYGAPGQTRQLMSDVRYSYDLYGNLTGVTTSTAYGYHEEGAAVYPTTELRTTTYAYADGGYNTYRTSEQNALGHTTSWVYNYRLGVPVQESDPNGLVTYAEYDGFGRLTKLIRPGESSAAPGVSVSYYDTGVNNLGPFLVEIEERHSGGAYNVRKFYNGLGQLLQVQTANAQVYGGAHDVAVDYAYNAYGQRTQETKPYLLAVWTPAAGGTPYRGQYFNQPKTVTSYDGFGRVSKVQSPTASEAVTVTYPADLQVRQCNGRNQCTLTLYDVWGRVVEVRPPAEPWLRYVYDEADRLVRVEQRTGGGAALFAATTMSYDLAGRKTAMSDPDLGSWSYTYDGAGNLRTQTDARNCRTTLSYDALDRVTQKSYGAVNGGTCGAATATVTYGYDAYSAGTNYGRGKRTSMTDGSGSTTWVYGDVRGRLTKETKTIAGGGSFVTEWAYDQANQLTWMRYPDGEQVTTSYLRQKLVNGVSGSSLYVQSTQYDAVGRVELRALGSDQVRIDPHYHPWTTQGGRMHWLVGRVGSSGAYLQALEYAYDAAGNVVRIVDAVSAGGVQTQTFGYDGMDRLTSAAATGGGGGTYSESYSYDSAGRLVNGPRGGGYVYGDAAHKHAVTAVSGGHSYAYDANGNLVSRTSGGQTLSFVYDAENRLVGVSGAASAAFVYDGDGRRVKGTVNGVTSYYVGDHYEVSGGVVKKYYSASGQRIAMRERGCALLAADGPPGRDGATP
ncbi:hypothetical protein [Caldilinea sp.]|uniref:hypothetical protein n=1 Tax=Caldilinea sp. TaxID=2293560 RepID=UPI0026335830|nr:hypothetical protein [Caldilinea sp.]